ncbi:MAG: hydantoinase/oxoprolinase family protein [Gammaproteobacteria bacterium]|nr:hydantoinase/oxoprolinase family protein [Gammaproteobacteria bacterium]
MKTILGVDTGGTFTDFVLYREGQLSTHKVLSTPHAPEEAILQGLTDMGLQTTSPDSLYIVHGSTVATNAVLEGKGVSCVFITNHGLRDMLTIGRQTRRELYNLQPEPPPVPVAREFCLETGGRLAADGSEVEPLTMVELDKLSKTIEALAPEAVAINLLFSYLEPRFEIAIEDALADRFFVSRSSSILPEFREYERGMTTWLNAYVGPLVAGYLERLQQGVPQAAVSVMQSSGGTIAANQAGRQAVHMLLSGPAGGLAAAQFLGSSVERTRLLTFDMGGTSTDVAMIDGALQLTSEGKIAGYPVAVPMVDMHTIGAGGGSIAYVDSGGMLQVGPESAGAAPGPACYDQGGKRPTVTDANLILGRLRPDAFLGGKMRLNVPAARHAMQSVAQPLGLSPEQAAEGVVRIANEHMAHALRVMSVQRGIDPRGLTLVSFGGAGGLHVCALAESLGMQQAMVPIHAGVLSALGMLVAPRSRQLSRTRIARLVSMPHEQIDAVYAELEAQGRQELIAEGVAGVEIEVRRSLDLRYEGQSYYLNLPWNDISSCEEAFHRLHAERYGHELDLPVELVNLRVGLASRPTPLVLTSLSVEASSSPYGQVSLYGVEAPAAVYARAGLVAGQQLTGPALITETISTTYLAPDWRCDVDSAGNLLLSYQAE